MTIRLKILGGFAVILLLTLGVALVGRVGLSHFDERVEAARAADRVTGQIGELALVSARELQVGRNRDAGAHDAMLQSALAAVRQAIGAMAAYGDSSRVAAERA